MKIRLSLILTVSWISIILSSTALTQENNVETKGNMRGDSQVLTDEQKTAARDVLANYHASALSVEDAKVIHRSMRDIGIRGGRTEDDLLRSFGFDPEELKKLDPPPNKHMSNIRDEYQDGRKKDAEHGGNKYSLEQALSDNAQLSTIAFNGLAFLSGDYGAATFIPPGKVCDYFGFQYMRDVDVAQKGHNPMFLNRVAGNVLHILTDEQKKIFLNLAEEQAPKLEALAKMRLPLIKAFYMERDNQTPASSNGLNKEAVMRCVAEIFTLDAELSMRRAEVMARVALSLTPDQKAYLDKMKFGDFNTWPSLDERDEMKQYGRGKSKMFSVAFMTYASEFFSWIDGSEEADTYFCPERHGTYFGGFYMKDMPAMGKRDHDISTSTTGDNGKAFLRDVLTSEQRKYIEATIDLQRKALAEIVTIRRAISHELRKYLNGQTPDENKVITLGKRYGELDGEMSWYYVTAFTHVNNTLSAQQRAELIKLRNLQGYESAPYYIYSEAMHVNPELDNTDVLFLTPKQEK